MTDTGNLIQVAFGSGYPSDLSMLTDGAIVADRAGRIGLVENGSVNTIAERNEQTLLQANETYYVPTDYATIEEAVYAAVARYHKRASIAREFRVTITIETGYTVTQPCRLRDIDASFVRIESIGGTTVLVDTSTFPSGAYLFEFERCVAPEIMCTFDMQASNRNNHGGIIYKKSRGSVSGGVLNAGYVGLRVDSTSIVNARSARFTNGKWIGIDCEGFVDATQADVSGCVYMGVRCVYGQCTFTSGKANNIVSTDGVSSLALYAKAGMIRARYAQVRNASYGIYVVGGSIVDAYHADTSGSTNTGIAVTSASLILAHGATGTTNQAANTITASGIIIK